MCGSRQRILVCTRRSPRQAGNKIVQRQEGNKKSGRQDGNKKTLSPSLLVRGAAALARVCQPIVSRRTETPGNLPRAYHPIDRVPESGRVTSHANKDGTLG